MTDSIEERYSRHLKQDVDFVMTEHKQLMRSHISLTAEVAGLRGLIPKIAKDSKMDVNEILDTLKKREDEKKRELLESLKKAHPDYYKDLFGE